MVWDGDAADNPTRSLSFSHLVIRYVPTGWMVVRMDDFTQHLGLHRPVCVRCQGGMTINGYRLRPMDLILAGKADIQKMQVRAIIMNNVRDFEGHPGAYVGA